MISRLVEEAEKGHRKPEVPAFDVGDTVTVHVRIVEGDKERVQPFTGVVIGRRGRGISQTFTVRRIVNNEGVERIFPVHSPKLHAVEVQRKGKVRRAKLFFLRGRVGKARRLRERRPGAGGSQQPSESQPQSQPENP